MPVLRISSIQDDCICDHRPVFVDPEDYKEDLSRYEVHDGDLLIAMSGATTGKIGFNNTGDVFLLNQRVGKFEPKENLEKKFLFYFLSTQVEENLAISAGAAQPNLSTKQIKEFQIPLPPLEEQKRIVAVLDEAFAALDRARTHAETNLKNARELFDRVGAKLFAKATEGCEPQPLGEFAEFRNGLNFSQHSSGQEVGILGVGDFKDRFLVPLDDLKTVRMEGSLSPKDNIQAGDIFAVRSNGNRELIGRVLLADRTGKNSSFSGFTIRIRINSTELNPSYLCHYLKSVDARKRLVAGGGGANISNLNQKILSNLTVGVPDHARQTAFVEAMEELTAETEDLVRVYRSKLSDLDDLCQSLLQMAFAGELS